MTFDSWHRRNTGTSWSRRVVRGCGLGSFPPCGCNFPLGEFSQTRQHFWASVSSLVQWIFMVPSSPGLGKLRGAHGEEAWHRSPPPPRLAVGVQGEVRGEAKYELHPSQDVRLPGRHKVHPLAAALAALSPTLLPPGELEAGLPARGSGKVLTHPPLWSPARSSAHREKPHIPGLISLPSVLRHMG